MTVPLCSSTSFCHRHSPGTVGTFQLKIQIYPVDIVPIWLSHAAYRCIAVTPKCSLLIVDVFDIKCVLIAESLVTSVYNQKQNIVMEL
jgi:hypothetical protein